MSQESTFSLLFAVGLFVLYLVVWALCLLGWRTASTRYGGKLLPSRLASTPPPSVPGITIIRPLCGLDNNLYNALESSMKLEYPKYEVLFAVQDDRDEAIPIVTMVMERFPHVRSKLIVDDRQVGVNPKVNNLMASFEQAEYDLLWVVDSTISVTPSTLGRTVDAFLGTTMAATSFDSDPESTPLIADSIRHPPERGDVGLVHHVPYAVVYQKTWGGLLEQAFLNTTHAKMYLAINATAIDSCVMGKLNMYSKANIAALSTPSPTLSQRPDPPKGLRGFGPFLAEDNMIGLSLWHELGLKHAMTGDVALDFIGALSVGDYVQRRIRWIRVRKKMTPILATAIEPFTESVLCGAYGSWAIARLFGATKSSLFIVHMLMWLLVDLSVRRSLGTNVTGIGPPSSTTLFVIAWVAREVSTLPIWLYGITRSEVVWRGKKYRIMTSGEAVRVDD